MSSLRQSILLDTELAASKRRFALFSQPPSTAIGDDSLFRPKIVRRGEDCKPLTLPRNMLAGPNRSGVGCKSFIDPVGSIYLKDPYIDTHKRERLSFLELHSKGTIHQKDFVPSSGPKTQAVSPYKHIDDNPLPKIYPKRDDSGRIATMARNFTTNPMSKVDKELFKPLKHLADPLERKQQIESKERELNKQKMPPEMFRSMSHGDILFSSHKNIYGVDKRAEQFLKRKHSHELSPPVKINHDTKFKLARRGHGDPIGKFPEFVMPASNPEHSTSPLKAQKARKEEGEEGHEVWRPNGNKSPSRPTPSISYSSINLRKYF